MATNRIPGSDGTGRAQEVPDVGDKGLYTGTKIDSQQEVIESGVPDDESAALPSDMQSAMYTVGMWRVRPGQETDFVAAWQALGESFRLLPQPPAGKGTLVQSVSDPLLFYSFDPWLSLSDIEAMEGDEEARAGIEALRQLCVENRVGSYRSVAGPSVDL